MDEDDTMDLLVQRESQPAINKEDEDIFKSAAYDRGKSLNTAKSIFDKKAVMDTAGQKED